MILITAMQIIEFKIFQCHSIFAFIPDENTLQVDTSRVAWGPEFPVLHLGPKYYYSCRRNQTWNRPWPGCPEDCRSQLRGRCSLPGQGLGLHGCCSRFSFFPNACWSCEPALEQVSPRWCEKTVLFPAGALESSLGLILFLHTKAPRMM